jgi:C-terminal processing protease CtpA/Prc
MLRRIAVLLAFTVSLAAAPNPTPTNLDFEAGAPGVTPPGWMAPTAHLGYTTEITTDSPRQGKQAVRVSGAPKPSRPGTPAFGNVMQAIDATPFRGKRVRFRGAVRVEGRQAMSALWMRVDRAGKQMGFFDNMNDRPITSVSWTEVQIEGDVAPDAEVLNIGMMLQGEGTAWLDAVSLEVVAAAELRAGKPRPMTTRGLENLIAFTRLLGIVRHFHPSDEAVHADWNAVAVNSIDAIEGAKDAGELVSRLEEVFAPFAPTLRVYAKGAPMSPKTSRPAGAEAIVAWEHHGFGTNQAPRGIYVSERVRRRVGEADARYPDPTKPLIVDLGGGVSASVPLSVYADATRTLPRALREPLPLSNATPTGDDRATRIAGVILLWNVLQNFYPYFDVVDVDWPAELRTALRAAGDDRDGLAFLRTLRRMVASIDDGHGSVFHPLHLHRATLPVLWRVAEKSVVITAVDPAGQGIAVGDEVLAIDGKPAMQAVVEAEELVSGATPQWRQLVALRDLSMGPAGSERKLIVRGADGMARTVKLAYSDADELLREKRPDPMAELKPGFWYVDLERVTDPELDIAMEKLKSARGIVFDLRGYPRVGSKQLRHFVDGLTESARWIVPIVRRPDRVDVEWSSRPRWQLQPLEPRLPKNLVFLTDGRAISYAESWMGIIEAYKLAAIVGEPTAGTNGNINSVTLPGDYKVIFTGMRVLKHDGSRHHGVGIVPTAPVSPTIAGIRAGRDEQLERALAILEK